MRLRALALAGMPLVLLIAGVAIAVHLRPLSSAPDTLLIGRARVQVELATTTAARELGLGDREGLAPGMGMLFVFSDTGSHPFWMKDMLFSIDMVWLDAAGRVVYVRELVSPVTYPATFDAPSPSRYVLELPAGYARAYAIERGDEARFADGRPITAIPAQ